MKRSRIPYIFLIPFFVSFAIFWVFPFGFAAFMSFTNWNALISIDKVQWVGLQNYMTATQDDIFLLALKNTFIYVLYEPVCISIGLILALVLNTAIKGRSWFRTIYFVPVITSTVAIAYVWNWLYDYRRGPFNYVLRLFGLPAQSWLSYGQALYAIMLMSTWQWIGLNVVIFLAALQSIPKEYHEAARISGANVWNCFRHVTVPLLKPTILFAAVTATAGSLQVFTEVYMLTQGGPANSTMVAVLWMYKQAFEFIPGDYGYACALAFILFLIILAIALIEVRLMRRGGMVYY